MKKTDNPSTTDSAVLSPVRVAKRCTVTANTPPSSVANALFTPLPSVAPEIHNYNFKISKFIKKNRDTYFNECSYII